MGSSPFFFCLRLTHLGASWWDKLSHFFACNCSFKGYNDLTKGKKDLRRFLLE